MTLPLDLGAGLPANPYDEKAPYFDSATPPHCPFCDQPVTVWKGKDDPKARMIAAMPDGSFAWAHVGCVHHKRKGKRTVVEGYHERREHPPCALCGEDWDDHDRFGHVTRSCPEPHCLDGTQLYHHAPGKLGVQRPEWLRIEAPMQTAVRHARMHAWGETWPYRNRAA